MRKRSPLYPVHATLGARFTDFAGWRMPLRYASETVEHQTVRARAGLFDLSHLGQIEVTGPEAARALDYALVGHLSALEDGAARYTMLCHSSGGILDDLGKLSSEEFRAAAAAFFPLASPDWLSGEAEAVSQDHGVAMVAHDARKPELLAWARDHAAVLAEHRLYGTGTTSSLLSAELGLPVTAMRSGPLGGDQQIGASLFTK